MPAQKKKSSTRKKVSRSKTGAGKRAAAKKKAATPRKKAAPGKKSAIKEAVAKLSKNQEKVLENIFHTTRKRVRENHVEEALKKTPAEIERVSPRGSFLQGFVRRLELLYDLLRSGVRGEYKLPWKMIAAITAALVYFISPIDLIPDPIPVVGYLDDAFIILLCINFVREELLDYCKYKGLNPKDYGLV